MVPHIPGPGEPLEPKSDVRRRAIGRILVIVLIVWTAISCIIGLADYVDLFLNGPVPLRPGYIPKAQRIDSDVKFVPRGEDPAKYVKMGGSRDP